MSTYLELLCTSRVVSKALTLFVNNPDQFYRPRELANLIGEDSGNVQRFLVSLTKRGFLIREEQGRFKLLYKANPECSVISSLKKLASQHPERAER